MNPRYLAVYIALAILNLLAVFIGWFQLEAVSKSLLMPLLIAACWLTPWGNERLRLPVTIALAFSWLGDVTLLFQSSHGNAFLLGLGFFLIGHIAYVLANIRSGLSFSPRGFTLPASLILLALGVFMLNWLTPGLGSMQLPVTLYTLVILTMGVTALMRRSKTNSSSFGLVVLGALLFILSDSLIALNKFLVPIPQSGLWIMSTYLTAQVLLLKGYLRH